MQANVEYWFRLLYECLRGTCYGVSSATGFSEWLVRLWLWIIGVGYLLSFLALFVIVYTTVRIFQLRKREAIYYGTVIPMTGAETGSPRWKHIESLSGGTSASEWREA